MAAAQNVATYVLLAETDFDNAKRKLAEYLVAHAVSPTMKTAEPLAGRLIQAVQKRRNQRASRGGDPDTSTLATLNDLPVELLDMVVDYLDNPRDLRSAQQTSRLLLSLAEERLDDPARVPLSFAGKIDFGSLEQLAELGARAYFMAHPASITVKACQDWCSPFSPSAFDPKNMPTQLRNDTAPIQSFLSAAVVLSYLTTDPTNPHGSLESLAASVGHNSGLSRHLEIARLWFKAGGAAAVAEGAFKAKAGQAFPRTQYRFYRYEVESTIEWLSNKKTDVPRAMFRMLEYRVQLMVEFALALEAVNMPSYVPVVTGDSWSTNQLVQKLSELETNGPEGFQYLWPDVFKMTPQNGNSVIVLSVDEFVEGKGRQKVNYTFPAYAVSKSAGIHCQRALNALNDTFDTAKAEICTAIGEWFTTFATPYDRETAAGNRKYGAELNAEFEKLWPKAEQLTKAKDRLGSYTYQLRLFKKSGGASPTTKGLAAALLIDVFIAALLENRKIAPELVGNDAQAFWYSESPKGTLKARMTDKIRISDTTL